jgi:hypothetical protein
MFIDCVFNLRGPERGRNQFHFVPSRHLGNLSAPVYKHFAPLARTSHVKSTTTSQRGI